jgi:hypothetical protein
LVRRNGALRKPGMTDQWSKNRPSQPDADTIERDDADSKAKRRREENAAHQRQLDDALDRGLEDTFPGSDPVSIIQPPPSPHDRKRR